MPRNLHEWQINLLHKYRTSKLTYFVDSPVNSTYQKKSSRYIKPKVWKIWLIDKSKLTHENKVNSYKTIIKLIWTYEILLWGCSSKELFRWECYQNLAYYIQSSGLLLTRLSTRASIALSLKVIKTKSIAHNFKLENHTNIIVSWQLNMVAAED